ncbi:hypothetical protein M0R04_11805 [Candidatus Dojkabacteria bacterium]|jgi:hypothetical protein|nr:hypothetical protein [Candidatus Dojkabacteria bacterium]
MKHTCLCHKELEIIKELDIKTKLIKLHPKDSKVKIGSRLEFLKKGIKRGRNKT